MPVETCSPRIRMHSRRCIQYIQSEMRPAAESQPGSLGLSLLASPELGAAVLESFWASDHALRAAEKAAAAVRGELARRAGGPVTVQEYRVAVFEREAPLHGGEGVRLTRIEVKPSAVDDVIEAFGDSAVPLARRTPRLPQRTVVRRPGYRATGQRDRLARPSGAGGQPERRCRDPGRCAGRSSLPDPRR